MTNGAFASRFGPWAVVTGASDGIGRAFAEEIAAAGLNVVMIARRAAVLEELADRLAATHGVVVDCVAADLSTPDGTDRAIQVLAEREVGLLVACAGFGTSGAFVSLEPADECAMLDVNCRAVVALCHAAATRFGARRRGGIVLMGSIVGWQGTPHAATYAATKAFVQSFAEGLHVELKPQGVDVLAVAPGPVASGFATRARMRMGATDEPGAVARAALAALGRRSTIVPGRVGLLLTSALALLPRWARVRIMGRIMAGMAERGVGASAHG